MAADFFNAGSHWETVRRLPFSKTATEERGFSARLCGRNQKIYRRLTADCFKKITVFVILLFIAYSPLRCQKEQDSPQPRTKMLDYRFPTALQMVLSVAMAEQMGERSTSAILAYGLEANPSFIRKLMVPLTRDGIIVSTLGRNGSIHLGARRKDHPARYLPFRYRR
jgi:hypothetical protein